MYEINKTSSDALLWRKKAQVKSVFWWEAHTCDCTIGSLYCSVHGHLRCPSAFLGRNICSKLVHTRTLACVLPKLSISNIRFPYHGWSWHQLSYDWHHLSKIGDWKRLRQGTGHTLENGLGRLRSPVLLSKWRKQSGSCDAAPLQTPHIKLLRAWTWAAAPCSPTDRFAAVVLPSRAPRIILFPSWQVSGKYNF